MKRLAVFSLLIAICVGCASVNSTFYPRTSIVMPPKKSANEVEVRSARPTRTAFLLGEIALGGNDRANYDTLIKVAQEKAAARGADFIVIIKTSAEQRNVVLPGYSSYQGFGSAYGSGFGNTYNATAQYNASGYSVGSRAVTVRLPNMNVMAGKYFPARLGIEWEREKFPRLIVTQFELNSHGEEAGLKIGDEIVGIDGIDAKDESLPKHMLQVQPGQKVHLTVRRDGERMDVDVEMIRN